MASIVEQIVRLTVDGDETRAEVIGTLTRCENCRWFDKSDPAGTWTANIAYRCKRVPRLWMENDAFCKYGEPKEAENEQS